MLLSFCVMSILCQLDVPATERIRLRLVTTEDGGLVQVYTLSSHAAMRY
jgi:hypothetical protein